MITAEQILESVIEQTKQGSCKTCRWMRPMDPDNPMEIVGECEIQGNMNPIWFSESDLDRITYPFVCCEGDMGITSDDGITMCLAYQPKWAYQVADAKAIVAHRQFMTDLADAARLAWAIQENTLAKLTAKLNEATESLPGGLQRGSARARWDKEHGVVAHAFPINDPDLSQAIDDLIARAEPNIQPSNTGPKEGGIRQ